MGNLKPRPSNISISSPLRLWPHRLLFILAVIGGFALTIAGRNDALVLQRARLAFLDWMAPILSALSAPVITAHQVIDNVNDYLHLRQTNIRLQQENALLIQWQQIARDLKTENENLRKLLHFQPVAGTSFITAPVIADIGGDYSRSAIVLAGTLDQVDKGQAVLGDYGLIGRIQEAGTKASRVLLLTDINSRLPVLIERTRLSAILSGASNNVPELTLLTGNNDLQIGDRILTSGAGGLVPAGLPVGKIASIDRRGILVQLYADLDRLSFVRIVNFGLPGILPDTSSARPETSKKIRLQ